MGIMPKPSLSTWRQLAAVLLLFGLHQIAVAQIGTAPAGTLSMPTALYLDSPVNMPVSGKAAATGSGQSAIVYSISVKPLHSVAIKVDPATGTWTYVPAKGRIGPDRFEISATKGSMTARTKIVVLTHRPITRRTWYVDAATGKDSNDGASEANAFASIQAAHDVSQPGDTVLIKNGTYLEKSNEAVVHIKRSGAPGAMITYKAFPGHRPVLKATRAWNHVLITASYIRVEGLEIFGNARNIAVADSEAVYARFLKPETRTWGPETSFVNTNGIFVRPENSTAALFERIAPRHIEILGNLVHDVPGGGIATDMADYVTIALNTVHNNAYRSIFANSGISVFHPFDTDENYSEYKNVIANNIAYKNRVEVKWFVVQKLSDGNGIIVDDTRNSQIKGIPYKGRTLVVNNVVFENGGSGIQTFSSDNVDIIHNTAYYNTRTPELDWGQILSRTSSNVRILNNIMVAAPGDRINEDDRNLNAVFDYNLYFGDRKPDLMGQHDIIGDPKFAPPRSKGERSFMLAADSPAIDSGLQLDVVATDLGGKPRLLGAKPDRGAFEFTPK
jgi:parallel beta-helix repeat protein